MNPAQDPASLAGKVLRLNPDGSVPDDKPLSGLLISSPPDAFPMPRRSAPAVQPEDSRPLRNCPYGLDITYSLGHRNVQGLAWRPSTGQLYAAEHGPTGENAWCCHDEINLIEPGGNYGWPIVIGMARDRRFLDPVVESGEGRWPPGGLSFGPAGPWADDLFVASLAGGQLWRFALTADGQAVAAREQLIAGEYGRLRGLAVGPDGALYVGTSNRDGRGRPNTGDDRILRRLPSGE